MRTSKFYASENFPLELVKELHLFGYSVLTSYEAGQYSENTTQLLDSGFFQYHSVLASIFGAANQANFSQ